MKKIIIWIVLAVPIWLIFCTFRYQIRIRENGVIMRFDRWTGQASLTSIGHGWRPYERK